MHRICIESKAAETLYTKATSAVQSVVVGDYKAVWVFDIFTYIGQHYLLGYEGLYIYTYFVLTQLCCVKTIFAMKYISLTLENE